MCTTHGEKTMLRVRHPKGKTEVTLGNFKMVIDTKEINPDRMAHALEMLTNNYTRSQELHHEMNIKYGNLLMDYAELKARMDGLEK